MPARASPSLPPRSNCWLPRPPAPPRRSPATSRPSAAAPRRRAAVGGIDVTIREISGIAGMIAAAVEQQGAATAEIARNVAGTAASVAEINVRTADVSREAEHADGFAREVLDNTRGLDGAVHE